MATTFDLFAMPTQIGVNVTANASSEDYYYEYDYDYDDSVTNIPLSEALPVTFTYALTLVLGLIGNVLVIFSIAYYRRMRTTTNVFLFSLASADLLLVLICVPVKAAAFLTFSWRFGEELCKIVNYLQSVSMVCSVLTLTTISLERMVAVVAPLKARTMCTKRHALVVVLVVWILSFLLAAPTIAVMNHREVGFRYKAYWCVKEFSTRPLHIAYEMYMFLLLFFMPMGVMVVTYVIICLKVWRFTGMRADMRSGRVIAPASRERLRQEGPGMDNALLPNTPFMADTRGSRTDRRKQAGNEDTKTTMQLVMMLVIVVVLFAICWGPILINNLLVAFEVLHPLHYGYLKPMRIAFNVMSYFNSCVNPIVYAFLSKNFRQSFVLAISACVRGQAFVRAYRFSMSIASTRTSAVSNGRLRPGSNFNREKSSSSGNEYTQAVPATVPDDQLELTALSNTKA